MITLQELLNEIKLTNIRDKQFLSLFIKVNENLYELHIGNDELRKSKAEDIIRQAFPYCHKILDSEISIESVSHSDVKTKTIAIVKTDIPKILPYEYFKHIVEDIASKSNNSMEYIKEANELYAYAIASLLFTFFHGNQIEEFNSTWENMYTNWKRYEVNKI